MILFTSLLVCLVSEAYSQCRYVRIPMCGDDVTSTSLPELGQKGQKGDTGFPGKAGPKGGIGETGVNGNPGNCSEFQTEIKNKLAELESLLTPVECLTSSTYGVQRLRNGDVAFCDGGWTVFQRRWDGSESFDRNWEEYKNGFGSPTGEFWLGLENVYQQTKLRGCKLRIDLWSFDDDHAFAQYSDFALGDENDNYRLHLDGYSGTAGDSLGGDHSLDNMPFTTKDRDNDQNGNNCALNQNNGGGWWHKRCYLGNANAAWMKTTTLWHGIIWKDWKGNSEALKATSMKFRCD